MSRDVCGSPAGDRECVRARFEHPYHTFAPACFTLAHTKSISEDPYRTFASVCLNLAHAKSISEHPWGMNSYYYNNRSATAEKRDPETYFLSSGPHQ